VIATGITTTVREFSRMTFAELGIELEFVGEGAKEEGIVKRCNSPEFQLPIGKAVIKVDENYFRPTEVDLLIGDPSKANRKLGWKPKHDLASLVKDMIWADVALFRRDEYLLRGGHNIMNYHE
jgi:GDPmannose 4,6-dehydratase